MQNKYCCSLYYMRQKKNLLVDGRAVQPGSHKLRCFFSSGEGSTDGGRRADRSVFKPGKRQVGKILRSTHGQEGGRGSKNYPYSQKSDTFKFSSAQRDINSCLLAVFSIFSRFSLFSTGEILCTNSVFITWMLL